MSTAGYSGKPLATKLGIRPGDVVALLGEAPANFRRTLGALPDDVEVRDGPAREARVAILFARERSRLAKELPAAAKSLPEGAMLWVAWPKKAAKQPTDLTEDAVREIGLPTGWVDVKVCAVDDVWSGLKFLRRRA